MMSTLLSINPAMLTAFALNVFLAVSVISLVTLLAVRMAFRHNPSVRYFLSLIGLIAILLSPLIVGMQERMGFSIVTLSLPASFSPSAIAEVSPTIAADSRASASVREVSSVLNGIAITVGILLVIWAAGVVLGTIRLIRGWKQVSRLTEDMQPWDNAAYPQVRANTSRILGCVLPPIYTASCVTSPVAVGLLRPVVILPAGLAEALLPVQLQHILLHECAHIVHRHMIGGVVERVTRLLFWMHPLVSLLCRELAWAREEVCDNVASQESGAICYARTLFALAQGILPAPPLASALALLGPETSLEQRISGLLHPGRNRMVRIKQGKLWAVTGVAVLALVSTIGVRVVAATGNSQPLRMKIADGEMLVEKRTENTPPQALSLTLDGKEGTKTGPLDVVTSEGKLYIANAEGEVNLSPAESRKFVRINTNTDTWSNVSGAQSKTSAKQDKDAQVFVTTEDETYTLKSGDGQNWIFVKADPNDPLNHDARYTRLQRTPPQKEDHASAIHHFLSHVHQIFGGLFAAFHPQPDVQVTETLDRVGEQSTAALDKVVEKRSER